MKIINVSFGDSAGAAYSLAHALNKEPNIQAINLRANNNYIDYPTITEMRYYGEESAREMVYKADVVVFHTAVQPFFTGLHLDKNKLKNKKLLLYFHGSDARTYGTQIIKQADELMTKYEVLVSTPDLLREIPQALWMPVARCFKEIRTRYGLNERDQQALNGFDAQIRKTVVSHAPTNQERKGSVLFLKVITSLIKAYPNVEYQVIQQMTWDACLRAMSKTSIYYDQHVIGAYGLAAVEASIFKAAVFCKLTQDVIDVMEKTSGLHNPFIQWTDEEDIQTKSIGLMQNRTIRTKFGQEGYNYCKHVHDEKPVVARFLKIVEDM